ncbi:maleylpyruvate isomerase family mycothiol-dependent enzyme [Nocardia terpenica]|uniref:maleylpyruvate isomerase family mycothiol-dependent enzyme n=1 Tax=Nocardia terpenica TaxID=455432 RepID=UPI002FDF207A
MTTIRPHAEAPIDPTAYRAVRRGLADLAARLRDRADATVPATPGWTVREVIAHVVEISGKVASRTGGEPGARGATPARASAEIADLLTTWDRVGATVDRMLPELPPLRARILMMDSLTHELDVRHAIGADLAAPQEHPAFTNAFELLVQGFSRGLTERALPALRLETESEYWIAGEGRPAATVRADRFDLYRSLAGRRTREQIASLSWSAEPRRWLPAFEWGPFHLPPHPTERPTGGLS